MSLLFLGDFLYDYCEINKDIKRISAWIKENNYRVILNLEGPFINSKADKRKKRGLNLYQDNIAMEVLRELNVVGVTLANNHMMDYGESGLDYTIKVLNQMNIAHTGAGKNLYEACRPMKISGGG